MELLTSQAGFARKAENKTLFWGRNPCNFSKKMYNEEKGTRVHFSFFMKGTRVLHKNNGSSDRRGLA